MGYGDGHESYVLHIPIHVPSMAFLLEGASAVKGTDGLVLTILDCEGDGGVVLDEGVQTALPRPGCCIDPRTPT